MYCKVLMDGYEVFRSWMIEHTGLDVDKFITIQSMASTFVFKSGCYQNVYQISGELHQFITKCVVGGRVPQQAINNIMLNEHIAYFDACSLYPSAMYKMEGFLEGKPNVLRNRSYEFLKQHSFTHSQVPNSPEWAA